MNSSAPVPILRSDPLFRGEKPIIEAVQSISREDPTFNLMIYNEAKQKIFGEHTTLTGWMVEKIIKECDDAKFPSLLDDFDQPRIYKGVWL